MNSTSAIEIDDLTIRFGDRTVVERFSLHLATGDRVTLTGPSGSGKSTILRCILGFIPTTAGSIRIAGQPLTSDSVWQLRTHMAYVAQEPDLGQGTVRALLHQPFAYRANADRAGNLTRIPELCDRLALSPGLLDDEIGTLSGGEKQRVAIIAALLLERRLLLLDEPSSALDSDRRQAVIELLRTVNGLTVLAVAHDPSDFAIAERTVALPALSPIAAIEPGAAQGADQLPGNQSHE